MTKKLFLLFYFFYLFNYSFSQTKFERESRIKRNEVPQKALNFIDSCFSSNNIYWIKETNFDSYSIEAKTKRLNEKYSIEFDTIGNIQDVESDIELEQIPEKTKLEIIKLIERDFTKYKFDEIQTQWLGGNKALYELIKTKKTNEKFTLNYEIVIKGVKLKKHAYFELLFDSEGNLLKTSEIIENNSDNLEFH